MVGSVLTEIKKMSRMSKFIIDLKYMYISNIYFIYIIYNTLILNTS